MMKLQRKISCEGLMNYIIDNELTDSIALILHPETFDALALDYLQSHTVIERPFELLGIQIIEDTSGKVPRNTIHITEID